MPVAQKTSVTRKRTASARSSRAAREAPQKHEPVPADQIAPAEQPILSKGTAPRRASIGAHLMALLAVQFLLVSILIAYAGVNDFRTSGEHATEAATADASLAADALSRTITQVVGQLNVEAALPGYEAVFNQPDSCTLTSPAEDMLGADLHIVTASGAVACTSTRSQGGIPGPGYGTQPWFSQVARSKKSFTAGPLIDPVSHKHAFLIVAPIQSAGGAMIASLKLDATGLDQRLVHGSLKPIFLVTTADRMSVITRSGGWQGTSLKGTAFRKPLQHAGEVRTGLDGVQRVYAESTVADVGWHVFAGISTNDAFSDARKSLRDRAGLGILMVLLFLAAGGLIQRRFLRPIRSLSAATKRATDGDLDVRITPSGPSEIARLAESFNFMLGVRAKAEAALVTAFNTERDATDRLRELDTMKNSFLLAISHELRTPLTAVSGFASLLADDIDKIPADQSKWYADRIRLAAQRLERLMLELLDFDRMSRGILEAHLTQTDIRELVDRVVEQLGTNGRVSVEVRPGIKANVDAALLERVIENLVVNATKHTPPETPIWVRAHQRNGEVILTVEDKGKGVPEELRTKIFEPFEQGDVPSHSPGTGVGLALVAQFAKLHGGRAWVQDRRGGGASFRVALPLGSAPAA